MPNSIQMKPGSTTYYKMRMEITTAALDKYPDLPSRTLARLLHKQHPEIYVSVELGTDCHSCYEGRTWTRTS